MEEDNPEAECLPAPPPHSSLQSASKTEPIDSPNHSIMSRPGVGTKGRQISLLVNQFKVSVENEDAIFYQYNVRITYGDDLPLESKILGRRVIDKLCQINGASGEHAKRSKHSFRSEVFKVDISYSTKVALQSVSVGPKASSDGEKQDALRVLDIILRNQAANKGCLVIRQSFFNDDTRNAFDVGGGLTGLHGFHSTFRKSESGLALNLDVSTTVVIKPGPVLDFLLANQNVREPRSIDWGKARKTLKNLQIKTSHTNMQFKITGLSEKPCYQQRFLKRIKNGECSTNQQPVETTVFEYFFKHQAVELSYSKYMPCIDVGKPNFPIYLPIEVCSLVPLQRYKEALSPSQRASLAERSRQKPRELINVLTDAARSCQYDKETLLVGCGISIHDQFMEVSGRVLDAPQLKVGKGEDCIPCNGRWSFNNKQFLLPVKVERWAIVNFSARCDTSHLSRELISCGRSKGVLIERPYALVEEDPKMKTSGPLKRVDEMLEKLQDKLPDEPEFILCVLPERKRCELYGPWKMRTLCKFGVTTQCASPVKITNQYLDNLLLKINSKLGGVNSLLAAEQVSCIPPIKDIPTMILGMDVSHGCPGLSDIPSIAAVVGSLSWPSISRYRAAVRSQSPKAEIIDCLFKPLADGNDDGIMRELLCDFCATSKGLKPKQIIIFRDGIGESQFDHVLDIELKQIKQAYLALGEVDLPKFTVIVAQKNHHLRLFQSASLENVLPGTIVDTEVVHPRNYDFYLCSHAGMFGTVRPTHYHVLLDEIGFSPDELQNFINSLCYVYQRSTRAVSVVAPISYAHHAAKQFGQFHILDEIKEAPSTIEGVTATETKSIPELPRLNEKVECSMFFC
ncbi:hypothetical protein Droror1_Dr00001511 [Drosera rotundifolia]